MPCCVCLQSLLERNVGTRNVGDPQPLIAEFWSENDCACCLASWTMRRNTFRPLNQTKTKVQTCTRNVTGDTVENSLNGHIWPCFVQYEAQCDPQHRVWVSLVVHQIPREVHFE